MQLLSSVDDMESYTRNVEVFNNLIKDKSTNVSHLIKPLRQESEPNYIKGSMTVDCLYLIKHFCSPGGTILDMSNDPRGTYYNCSIILCRNLL